jgi:Cellulase (glycosyl hydrolase family 5)
MLKRLSFLFLLWCGLAFGQSSTTVTTYQAELGGVLIGAAQSSLGAAQALATANGPGSYVIVAASTTTTVTSSTATSTFVVAAPASPNNTTVPPASSITDASGNVWAINAALNITKNGAILANTANVQELAYVSSVVWQESTNLGGKPLWWYWTGSTWLPANGTATSPLPASCGVAPVSTTATIACPAGFTGSWTQTTTYASAAYPTCWTPVLVPAGAPAGTCVANSAPPTTGVTRPAYNTGSGFFVLNGKLYDANGSEFIFQGVDRAHYDSPSQPGISNAKANAVRLFMYHTSVGAAAYANVAQTQHVAYNEVPIITMAYFPDNTASSCNSSTTELAAGASWWAANASAFSGLQKSAIINLANEWGPANSATWASANEAAVATVRVGGWLGPILIDSGGCGQDMADLTTYSGQVFNSDPQKNVIFALHIYGNIPTASVASDIAQLAALAKSTGAVYAVTEFGPGNNIGPSPTLTTPQSIVAAAQANGLGWLAWAWDDNNLSGGASNNSGFSMTLAGPGTYTGTGSQLTSYGQVMVPLIQTATPASIFQ